MEPASFCNHVSVHVREQSIVFEFSYQEPKTPDDPTIKEMVMIKTIAMETTLFQQALCPMMSKLCGSKPLPPSEPDKPAIRPHKP